MKYLNVVRFINCTHAQPFVRDEVDHLEPVVGEQPELDHVVGLQPTGPTPLSWKVSNAWSVGVLNMMSRLMVQPAEHRGEDQGYRQRASGPFISGQK
jgi:hypothetical protein